MKKALLFGALLFSGLKAGDIVVSHDDAYFKAEVRNTQLIFTKSNLPFAQDAAKIETLLQPQYEKSFAYTMDEKLYVGLISDKNQIANGFSTQYPYNEQINYIGGALDADYFSSTSWLYTLLYHETAHNYQLNAKDNPISSTLHTLFKNGFVMIPWFTLPNIVESSFFLEGNAVLNESLHGNGGRLYSGRFYAQTLMQAKAHKLKPELVYNNNLNFLYGSHFYTLGGYFEYFLAQKYGLKKTNAYWKKHSQDWFFPFLTNATFRSVFSKDFETLIEEWSAELAHKAQKMHQAKGKEIASSQFFSPLNDDDNEIFFIINETGRTRPKLLRLDKKTTMLNAVSKSFISGKVIKSADNEYTTQGSNYVNPWRISIGLFDENAHIVQESASKVVQGYLSDGRTVYFDVSSSLSEPQLYVGNALYAQVNSSVYVKGEDIYYFKQKNKTRTLFKNKTALFSLKSYYSHVVGVDEKGGVYFIANSQYGSSLYRYKADEIARMSEADNIIDARVLNAATALVATVQSDKYAYKILKLNAVKEQPYEVKLSVKKKMQTEQNVSVEVNLEHPYSSVLDMHYSGANVSLGNDAKAGFLFDLSLNFTDPLAQNALSLYASRNIDRYLLAGVSYTNTQYFINYFLSSYAVLQGQENLNAVDENRDYGITANAAFNFYRAGYLRGDLQTSYYEDYQSKSRKPLSVELSLSKREQFGVSFYPNLFLQGALYGVKERSDSIYGAKAAFSREMADELYVGASAQYSKSDAPNAVNERGVKVVKYQVPQLLSSDPSSIAMPSLKYSAVYAQDALRYGVKLNKVLNYSAYYFTFPLSLRREALHLQYDAYSFGSFINTTKVKVDTYTASMTLDTLWFNKLLLPLEIKYIYSSDKVIAQEHSFSLNLGVTF
ncbi:hypothetical protein [Sulfurimonas sp.]|uniref:hypothetical protein n=1 Tax=Sulfurimonas sp. TaxID=2022749 RepID=UPI002621A100|nr:hypothetical protein [Sulfurimonas sp.]